jgi:enamine deaminase RidA (YjgF/YER057c/UK114 family)
MSLQRLHVSARYSEAAIFNGVVYLAGMVPECEAADIRSQTTDVLAQVDQRLAEAGSNKGLILRTQIYLADIKEIGANEVLKDAVRAAAPAQADRSEIHRDRGGRRRRLQRQRGGDLMKTPPPEVAAMEEVNPASASLHSQTMLLWLGTRQPAGWCLAADGSARLSKTLQRLM